MKSRLQRTLRAWLEREAESAEVVREASREAAAERALRLVFLRLPLDRPAAGFADRVLAHAGVALASGRGLPPWLPLPLFRAFAAVCLLLVGSVAIFLPRIAIVLAPDFRWSGWVAGVTEFVTGACQRLVDTLAAWEAFVGVGSTVADIIFSPTWVVVMAGSLLLSAAAMRALHDLIVPTRSM